MKWPQGVVYCRDGFLADTFAEVHGMHMTTYVRTALDIAARHGFLEGLVAVDWLLGHGVVTRNQLQLEVQRMRGRKGVGTVREVVRHAIDCSESPKAVPGGFLSRRALRYARRCRSGGFALTCSSDG